MKPEHEKYILNNVNRLSVKRISRALKIKEKRIWEFLEYHKGKEKQPDIPSQKIETPAQFPRIFLSIALIIVLGFTVYGNSLNGAFIWDDGDLVEDNRYIKNWSYLTKTFTQDIGAGSGREWGSYRPLQTVTYMIDYSLWQLNPKGYHLSNMLLHISVALSIYWLIGIISKNEFLSLMTGAFFVVHPIHTEAVTYISGRADPLSALFMLLCLIFYIKSPPSKYTRVHALMVLSYILALFSKENSLILPVLILLYHYSFKTKIKVKAFFSIVGIASAYILLRVTVLKTLLANVHHTTTLSQRLPGFFLAITNYTRLLFFPFDLHMEYGIAQFSWGEPKVIFGAVLLFILFIFAFRKKERKSTVNFFLTIMVYSGNIARSKSLSGQCVYGGTLVVFAVDRFFSDYRQGNTFIV